MQAISRLVLQYILNFHFPSIIYRLSAVQSKGIKSMETVTFIGSMNRGIEQNKNWKEVKKNLLREYEQLYKMTSGQWMHRYMFTAHPIYLLSMCLCNNNASIQCVSKAMNRISIYSTNCIWQFHYTNPNEGESVQTSPNYE